MYFVIFYFCLCTLMYFYTFLVYAWPPWGLLSQSVEAPWLNGAVMVDQPCRLEINHWVVAEFP